tara:strand:- start:68 stop:181 length:114 start_codon:yes stop_codon:yes gene_type:complete
MSNEFVVHNFYNHSKEERAVDDKWLNNYLKEERGNNG